MIKKECNSGLAIVITFSLLAGMALVNEKTIVLALFLNCVAAFYLFASAFQESFELKVKWEICGIVIGLVLAIPVILADDDSIFIVIMGSLILSCIISNLIILSFRYRAKKDRHVFLLLMSNILFLAYNVSIILSLRIPDKLTSNIFAYVQWISFFLSMVLCSVLFFFDNKEGISIRMKI